MHLRNLAATPGDMPNMVSIMPMGHHVIAQIVMHLENAMTLESSCRRLTPQSLHRHTVGQPETQS